jgi:hypothetical protein
MENERRDVFFGFWRGDERETGILSLFWGKEKELGLLVGSCSRS